MHICMDICICTDIYTHTYILFLKLNLRLKTKFKDRIVFQFAKSKVVKCIKRFQKNTYQDLTCYFITCCKHLQNITSNFLVIIKTWFCIMSPGNRSTFRWGEISFVLKKVIDFHPEKTFILLTSQITNITGLDEGAHSNPLTLENGLPPTLLSLFTEGN